MEEDIPVAVRMRVECARCGQAVDDTYEFDLPFAEADSMEEHVPGKMPQVRRPDSDAPETGAAGAVDAKRQPEELY